MDLSRFSFWPRIQGRGVESIDLGSTVPPKEVESLDDEYTLQEEFNSKPSHARASLDFYVRIRRNGIRARLKHTIAPFSFLKLKPQIELRNSARPLASSLEVKIARHVKFVVEEDGKNTLQVRVKAPLERLPAEVDVAYRRILPSGQDSVRVAFRAYKALFLKIPSMQSGIKMPTRLGNRVKATLRADWTPDNAIALARNSRQTDEHKDIYNRLARSSRTHGRSAIPVKRTSLQRVSQYLEKSCFSLLDATSFDVKVRCWEYN